VTGTVRIRWRGRTLLLHGLRDGAAGATVRGLPPGKRWLTVRYSGSTRVSGQLVRRAVRVG
jgi:hypothetical protein